MVQNMAFGPTLACSALKQTSHVMRGDFGDFINYSSSLRWVAKNCPWVIGKVFVSEYLNPLFKEIFKDFPEWEVFPGERAGEFIDPQSPIIGPEIMMNGTNVNPQLVNATGAHLTDLGFAYFANMIPAPKDAYLPKLDFPEQKLLPKVKRLHGKYAVVPTGSMTPSRWIEGKHLNPLIRHIKALGLTPVFLGKRDPTGNGKLCAHFAEDIAYDEGLDMRDQTSILDAACIMQHAAFTVGLDCGLLHLASCMKDSRVIFAYNITTPKHRMPRRNWGQTINVCLTPADLECAACQSRVKLNSSHTYHECIYGDTKCIDLLFGNDAARFKNAIAQLIVEGGPYAIQKQITDEAHGCANEPGENKQGDV